MMYLIFSFSAQTGEVSGELSYKISYNIVEIKSEILHEGKSYDELNYEANSIQFYVRKAAHMTEYFLLAVAVSFPLYVYQMCIRDRYTSSDGYFFISSRSSSTVWTMIASLTL